MKTREKGITLIALVITIIVLLLLAGVAIATLTGKDGIFIRAKQAKLNYSISSAKEKLEIGGDYATITADGVVYQEEDFAIDAIRYEVFDNNENTYDDFETTPYSAKVKIDKSLYGKILNVKYNIGYNGSQGYSKTLTMYCYDEKDKLIGSVQSSNETTVTVYNYDFEIPENCTYIRLFTDINFRIYEIKVKENEEYNPDDTTYRNLIPTVNGKTTIKNGVIVSASDCWDDITSGHVACAINENDNNNWTSASGNYNPHWYIVQFLKPKVVNKYELKGMHSWGVVPSFCLQASNDKKNWVNLEDEKHEGVYGYYPQTYSIQVDNNIAYKYYRIYIPKGGWTYGSSGGGLIYDLKMYGY